MKKTLALGLALLMMAALFMGCQAPAPEAAPEVAPEAAPQAEAAPAEETTETADAKLKVCCLLNGNLGDKSFFDSANAGMTRIADELGCETRVVEMGFDNTKWEPTLYDVSEQDYDIIIVGTWQMQEVLQKVAPEYPEKRYIIFDSSVDYSKGDCGNVYSITYKQNEASYLAGIVAASKAKEVNPDAPVIGVIAALDIPVLNDFIVGYIEGAKSQVPEIKVTESIIGDFNDTAKAKELALAQYASGVSVSMNVAAQAGLGLFEASKEKGLYAVGVDADQAMEIKESDPEKANLIITSVLKRVDNSVFRSVKLHIEGKLPYGTAESLGMPEEAVGIAINEIYEAQISPEVRSAVDTAMQKIMSGEIVVSSAFAMSPEEITALKTSVQP